MRVLIMGATGMLGHQLYRLLPKRFGETYGTCRLDVQVEDGDSVVRAISEVQPGVVVNCIGIVKQVEAAKDPLASILVNALFPHRLAHLCKAAHCRLIHISTDCVFSGSKGNYAESDTADAQDLYGRTKFLGEVSYPNCLTLRTSLIGHELHTAHGLLEWFLRQKGGTVRGYTKAIFSGVTTNALSDIIAGIITRCPELEGVWHLASEPISKFRLLVLVAQIYGLDIEIIPDAEVVVDRSLNGRPFRQYTGLIAPSWPEMIARMRDGR